MLVSFVIPVYNGAATVTQCLLSFTGEDLTGVEVILVDDASEDGTPEMASPLLP
ncbi:MAG: glycosyltransferase, partial [Nitrospirae bacterium]